MGSSKMVPYLNMFVFSNIGGVVADRLITKKILSVTKTRKLLNTIGFIIASFALIALPLFRTSDGAVFCSSIVLGFLALGRAGFAINPMDIAPRYAGILMGVSNTVGTLASIVGVGLTGQLLEASKSTHSDLTSAESWREESVSHLSDDFFFSLYINFNKRYRLEFGALEGKVEHGEAKIAAGALFPHDIIKRLNDRENDGGRVAELQWKRMVDDLLEKGKLHNCIAICDVSGSMSGEPMEVCVALALLLSELSEHPWNGQVITFSENPKLYKIEGGNLRSKTQFIRRMEAGYNTDFQKVFDLLLQVEIVGNLDKDKMIEKVFVFSDMEFDNARRPYGGCGG
ncbi:hypothetical protein IFM89_009150 [Coptis chinensis]|uniref:Uncharacterized protein n=1 Tax=Coptis chinensis TaxID=261450 RepID=A0A835HU45_9MAGN|nr:hypothetical protein IFM89_009150 [Coptis chinensis]